MWQCRYFLLVMLSLFFIGNVQAIVIGSNTTPARQAMQASFPKVDTNNEMRGFSIFEKGFLLEDVTATCTFNAIYPVSGNVNLLGGRLFLAKDLIFDNKLNFLNVGYIDGNFRSIEFSKTLSSVLVPTDCRTAAALGVLATTTMGGSVLSMDWSPSGQYLLAGGAIGTNELIMYYWDGTTLTATNQTAFGKDVQSVRWNKAFSNYVAVGRTPSSGNEVKIYKFLPYNGTFTEVTGDNLGSSAALAYGWHPSGKFLFTGTDLNSGELKLYTFNPVSGLFTGAIPTQVINIAPNQDPSPDCIDFAPGGAYAAVGMVVAGTAPTLLIYSFNAASLTLSTSAFPGAAVNGLDWSPTGSYIAVGLSATNNRLRIYKHNVGAATVTEVYTARVNEVTTVKAVQWNQDGTKLLVGTSNGTTSKLNIYTFDKTTETLTLYGSATQTSAINTIRWAPQDLYISTGNATTNNTITIYGGGKEPLIFNNTTIKFDSSVVISCTWKIRGKCRFVGQDSRLTFNSKSALVVGPGAKLTIDGLELFGVCGNNFQCMDNKATITLQNSTLVLSNDFTFSSGSFYINSDVLITGAKKFIYSSKVGSTIGSRSTLYFDQGTTFSYAPLRAKKNLLYMPDSSAALYLDGASLFSTTTGLSLSYGTLYLDNHVTISTQARNSGEAMILNNNLNVDVLSGAVLDVYGFIRYS